MLNEFPKTFEEATLSRLIPAYRCRSTDMDVVFAMKGATNPGLAVRYWLVRQAQRLDNETMHQRKWQRLTRNLRRANHSDTVATRERYVRGYGDDDKVPTVYKGVYRGCLPHP